MPLSALPAARAAAARAVLLMKSRGIADADPARRVPRSAAERPSPRRTSAAWSRSRPRSSRFLSVESGQPEALGRLVPRRSFQVAEHQRSTKRFGQGEEFLVEHREQFLPRHLVQRVGRRSRGGLSLAAGPPCGGRAGLECQQVCGLVQPVGDRRLPPGRSGFPGQQQERGLADIFRVVGVAQHSPPDGQNHRPVAADQGLERRLVVRLGETAQQFPVGDVGVEVPRDQPVNTLPVDSGTPCFHRYPSRETRISRTRIVIPADDEVANWELST